MFFTGYLSSTGSYSVSLPWSRGAFWVLLRPTSEIFAMSPWTPEVAIPFDLWNGGTLCPFCPYFNLPDSCILDGWPFCVEWASIGTAIAFQNSRVYSDTSTLALKLLFLAVLDLGALLNSN